MIIRRALSHEASRLTEISFSAKRYWRYPEKYFDIWREELTITRKYIEDNYVVVCEADNQVAAFASLIELTQGFQINDIVTAGLWLEHMFIQPAYIGRRIGSELFRHCIIYARVNGFAEMKILADPHALGFYVKMGCSYRNDVPSTIPKRTTPFLIYALSVDGEHSDTMESTKGLHLLKNELS